MPDLTQQVRQSDAKSRHTRSPGHPLRVSIITAAYNEEPNLLVLYDRISKVLDDITTDWEWIVVDDHSHDGTFSVMQDIAGRDGRVRAMRFSRNFGSHVAIVCGLNEARGECVITLAGDLQDPPELIPELISEWRKGADVVWAVRRTREDHGACDRILARLYYAMMRHIVGLKEMPPTGADFFLLGRGAVDALCRSDECNVSILGLITWMGFKQASIQYDKQPRLHGRSGWSINKKLKLVADSITAFSYFPIRLMSLLGVLFAFGGLGLAAITVAERLFGLSPSPSGTAMIITILLLGFGFMMTFLGILGEYLWRTFDEVRGRPRYIVERSLNLRGPGRQGAAGFARMPRAESHFVAPVSSVRAGVPEESVVAGAVFETSRIPNRATAGGEAEQLPERRAQAW